MCTESSIVSETGNGIFGRWITDEYGLPAYSYEMRHYDPRAVWDPVIRPKTNLHWHQLGNDRITANAYNLGIIKVFFGETGQLWLNEYDEGNNAHSGGWGWLITEEGVLIDRDDCIKRDVEFSRVFGTGYFSKKVIGNGIEFRRKIFAPAGDEPVLVSRVTIKNLGGKSKRLNLIEYWDVNFSRITKFILNRFLNSKIKQPERLYVNIEGSILSTIPASEEGILPVAPCYIDPKLPGVFLASISEKPIRWITDPGELFENGKPKMNFDYGVFNPSRLLSNKPPKKSCLAAVIHAEIKPYEERPFYFVYGYTRTRPLQDILESIKKTGGYEWENTCSFWQENSPAIKTIEQEKALSRELKWNSYYFNSSMQYDAYQNKHYIPQCGNYLFDSGLNGASRDFFENILTLTYYRPEAARNMLEFMMLYQKKEGGFFYNVDGYGKLDRLFYRPSDFGLWFLWALCEYVNSTRDFDFLEARIGFYPKSDKTRASVYEHARRSFTHLLEKVGTGSNSHLKIRLSDWNDEMTWLAASDNPLSIIMTILRGESVMNTAMACHILPMFEKIATLKGDRALAGNVSALCSKLKKALNKAWHQDHLLRAFSGMNKPFGKQEIWLEPLVWALMANDSLDKEKSMIALRSIRERLLTKYGLIISSSEKGSMTTGKGEQESGGIWFAINLPAAVAVSNHDVKFAWDILMRSTLFWHARMYPDKWYGIWSAPDAFNSSDSRRPGETWYQKSPFFSLGAQAYPVQNIHAHGQLMFALAKMSGLRADEEGWTFTKRIPYETYSFSCALYGINYTVSGISGYVCPRASGQLKIKLEIPEGKIVDELKVNGIRNEVSFNDGYAEFILQALPMQKSYWELLFKR